MHVVYSYVCPFIHHELNDWREWRIERGGGIWGPPVNYRIERCWEQLTASPPHA